MEPAACFSEAPPPLPARLLYATSARIGGIGLDLCAQEQLKASVRGGFLARAIAYQNRCPDIPDTLVRSLRWHPVRLISFLDRPYYYGAKRRYLDWIAARELAAGPYDFFHGWSGESLRTLRAANKAGLPSVLDIPTWHVAHGFRKHENVGPPGGWSGRLLPRKWLRPLPVVPWRIKEEYDRATVILTRSAYATETFLKEGFAPEKIFQTDDGADIVRFQPGEPPPMFRALFVGALIKRKGVHLLLEAWHRLNFKNAELVLVGFVHEEIEPYLQAVRDGQRARGRQNRARGGLLPGGDRARFPVAVRGLCEDDVRGGGVRVAADHHARIGRRGGGRGQRPDGAVQRPGRAVRRAGTTVHASRAARPDARGRPGAGAGAFHLGRLPRADAGSVPARDGMAGVTRGTQRRALKRVDGRGDRIRTCDLLVPNQALYQAKLHPGLTAPVFRPLPVKVKGADFDAGVQSLSMILILATVAVPRL